MGGLVIVMKAAKTTRNNQDFSAILRVMPVSPARALLRK
jgi:hypothetical protein